MRSEDNWTQVWDEAEAWLGDKVEFSWIVIILLDRVYDQASKFELQVAQVNVLMNNAGVFSKENWKLMNDVMVTGATIGTMMSFERW